MDRYVVTLGRFILEQERDHPGATGALTSVLYDLTQAAKLIHREVSKAGLVDILGKTGKGNVHGEEVQKLGDRVVLVVVGLARDATRTGFRIGDEPRDGAVRPLGGMTSHRR